MSNERDDNDGPVDEGPGGPSAKLIALLVLVIALTIFFFQNGQDAEVDYLWWGGQWPVWVVIGVSVVAGVLLDRLFSWQWRRARRRKLQQG